MKALTKIVGVATGAVLTVGLMGMTQASGHNGVSIGADANGHDAPGDAHQVGTVGADGSGSLSDQEIDRIRERGALPKLFGKVDGARNITISDNSVTSGRYKIIVRDTTPNHNWHITGAGVDKMTTVEGTGRFVFRVRLQDGQYRVVCDRHPTTMRFFIQVS